MAVDYKKEGRIAVFTINRPEQRNALDIVASQELREAMTNFRDDPELWIGIITGAGDRAFCSGMQVGGPGGRGAGSPYEALMAAFNTTATTYKPLIAAINGYALGGGLELALICDIRVAAENARFALPEVTLGMNAGAGGMQRVSRFIPRAVASWMVLSGQQVDAQEAYRVGLINKVVPLDKLMPTAMEMAETISLAAPLATRIAKEVIIRGAEMTLDQALQIQRDIAARYPAPEDRAEGGKAFAERRKPVWKGR